MWSQICVYSCFPPCPCVPALHSSLECYVPRLCDRHVTMSPNFLVSLTLWGCWGINQTGLRDTGPVSRAAWWCQQKLIRVWWLWWLAHKQIVTNSSLQLRGERVKGMGCPALLLLSTLSTFYRKWKARTRKYSLQNVIVPVWCLPR